MTRRSISSLIIGVLLATGCLGTRTAAKADEVSIHVWARELDGLGCWVVIADTLVFVPFTRRADWSPYQYGYWYWTAFGWTWYSFDPWGAITDHCGHWRHHRLYGWVWVPEPVCVWRPAVVTFFFGPTWIGWYPYDPGWTYWHGYEHGFDDGYWLGYAVGRAAGEGRANPGFVATTYEDFYPDNSDATDPGPRWLGATAADETASRPARDLSAFRVLDPVVANEAFNEAVRKGHVGPVPGGGSDASKGWGFIAAKTGVRPTEVPLRRVKPGPGVSHWFVPERSPVTVPDEVHHGSNPKRDSMDTSLGGSDVSPQQSPPDSSERVPHRQEVPREYRVVPARPPVPPSRMPRFQEARDPIKRPPDRVPIPVPARTMPALPPSTHAPAVDLPSGPSPRGTHDERGTTETEGRSAPKTTFTIPLRTWSRPLDPGPPRSVPGVASPPRRLRTPSTTPGR